MLGKLLDEPYLNNIKENLQTIKDQFNQWEVKKEDRGKTLYEILPGPYTFVRYYVEEVLLSIGRERYLYPYLESVYDLEKRMQNESLEFLKAAAVKYLERSVSDFSITIHMMRIDMGEKSQIGREERLLLKSFIENEKDISVILEFAANYIALNTEFIKDYDTSEVHHISMYHYTVKSDAF